MNKYYLAEKLLTDEQLTAELEANSRDKLFEVETSVEKLYENRVDYIKSAIVERYIKPFKNISGEDVAKLISQRDCIISNLQSQKSYVIDILIPNGNKFKAILEYVLGVTLEHIENYHEAEKLLKGERLVPVILDGNNTNLIVDGKEQRFGVKITDNNVTMENCHEAVKRLKELNCFPKKLEFLLSIFTKSNGNEYGDFAEECLLDKRVKYDVEENRMTIWENKELVYENNNGIVCDDKVALADCYM